MYENTWQTEEGKQWYILAGWKAMDISWYIKNPFKYINIFYFEDLNQVAQRGCGASIFADTHMEHGSEQPAPADPDLSREVGLGSSDYVNYIYYVTVCCYCDY